MTGHKSRLLFPPLGLMISRFLALVYACYAHFHALLAPLIRYAKRHVFLLNKALKLALFKPCINLKCRLVFVIILITRNLTN